MISADRGLLVIALSVLLVGALAAQQTPVRDGGLAPRLVGTAALSGVVLNDVTGLPVRRAVVSIADVDAAKRLTAVTDETGTFSFANLPDGRYSVTGSKQGYVTMSVGAKRPQRPGTPIVLAAGERRTGVVLRLPPGAVLSGVVRNRAGEPVPDVRILILRQVFGFDSGERTLGPVSGSGGGLGQATDDRGMYRIFGLPADDYFVVVSAGFGLSRGEDSTREVTTAEVDWATRSLQASVGLTPPPPPGRGMDYAPVFFPGVFTAAAATMVSVKAGEERTGIDVVLERLPMARITGTVMSPAGDLPGTLQVNVVAHETISGIPFSGFGNARVEPDGRFATGGLPPGDYTVAVRVSAGPAGRGAPSPSAAALFGMAVVTVNGADVDTTITLDSGVKVEGRLVFDGTTAKPPADLTKVRIALNAARSKVPTIGVSAVNADATGAFVFNGVTPGRYRLVASGAGGWFMRNATLDGRETLDEPAEVGRVDIKGAEIRLTDIQSEISGDLLDSAGHPAPQYFIIVFSADKTHWVPQSRRIQSVRPANDGKFKVLNLPAGEYYIVAVTDVEQGQWYDPAFLAELVGASAKITLGDGEKKTQSLRIK